MLRLGPVQIVTLRNDSWRGRWTYHEWRPPGLEPFVELVWESYGTTTEDLDRHFPHGRIELLVNVGGDRFDLVEPRGVERFVTTWLAGMQLGPVVCTQPRRHHVLGIRLKPAGAYALLGAPLREVTGLVIALEDVLGPRARELVDRCRAAASREARLGVAVTWVAGRLRDARPVEPPVAWAADEIERHGGHLPIARLRTETGFSKTRLVRAFRDQVGVPPKLFARIVRFRAALEMIERGPRSLADVALAAGYYDQPHFNAEFRELTGMSPRELLVARYPSGVPVPGSGRREGTPVPG
jgi:AraC-like DNA-binding protein